MIFGKLLGTVKSAYAKATESYDSEGDSQVENVPEIAQEPSRKRRRVSIDDENVEAKDVAIEKNNQSEIKRLQEEIEDLKDILLLKDKKINYLKERYGYESDEEEEEEEEGVYGDEESNSFDGEEEKDEETVDEKEDNNQEVKSDEEIEIVSESKIAAKELKSLSDTSVDHLSPVQISELH